MAVMTFPILILIGRPASGKSEIIDYLQKRDRSELRSRFHLNSLEVIDDFPMLWVWFEEDDILSGKFGVPRLHSGEDGYFLQDYMWDLLIERLDIEYHKRLRDTPDYHKEHTTIIEFSRGSEHGGYAQAFEHLSDDVLTKAGIVYVNVSYEEALRKNRRRFNPERPDSVLEHGLTDDKMERLYRLDDWAAFSASDPRYVTVRDVRVPYVVFENQDDVTTGKPEQLGKRLEEAFGRLWDFQQSGE
jgi:hypothetical protein